MSSCEITLQHARGLPRNHCFERGQQFLKSLLKILHIDEYTIQVCYTPNRGTTVSNFKFMRFDVFENEGIVICRELVSGILTMHNNI